MHDLNNLSNLSVLARAVLAQARSDAEAGCAEAREFLRAAERGIGWPGVWAELARAEGGGEGGADGGR
ncbi:MAG: hypothetical protein H5T97_02235 [Firmicutes bacterium]|nr:hypothetical protein [Bacillota bacterium]